MNATLYTWLAVMLFVFALFSMLFTLGCGENIKRGRFYLICSISAACTMILLEVVRTLLQ